MGRGCQAVVLTLGPLLVTTVLHSLASLPASIPQPRVFWPLAVAVYSRSSSFPNAHRANFLHHLKFQHQSVSAHSSHEWVSDSWGPAAKLRNARISWVVPPRQRSELLFKLLNFNNPNLFPLFPQLQAVAASRICYLCDTLSFSFWLLVT